MRHGLHMGDGQADRRGDSSSSQISSQRRFENAGHSWMRHSGQKQSRSAVNRIQRIRGSQRYVREMKAKYGLQVVPAGSPKKAVENCDIVVTAGPILKNPAPLIEATGFKNGGFA